MSTTPRTLRSRKSRTAFVPNEPPRGRNQTNEGARFRDRRETAASRLWRKKLRKTWRRGSSNEHDWRFFPGSLGDLTLTQIKTHGRKGYHYADGWNGLMEMVDRYGENHAPTLRITTTAAASRTDTPRVSMSPVNSEAEAQENITGADNQGPEDDQQGRREEEEQDNGDDDDAVEPMELDEYHTILDCTEKLSSQIKFLERTSVYTAAEKTSRIKLLKMQLDNCYKQLDQMVV